MLEQNKYKAQKASIYQNLVAELGGTEKFQELKENSQNQGVANYVLNSFSVKKIRVSNGEIIQLKDPVYHTPDSKLGRAHLYAPIKKLGNIEIDTFWFNITAIWFMTIIMYFSLQMDLIRKMMDYIENIKVTKGWTKKILRV
jgi:hypothetical protein